MSDNEHQADIAMNSPAYLSAMALCCNLGSAPEQILHNLLTGSQAGLQLSTQWLPAPAVRVGAVKDAVSMPVARVDGSPIPLHYHSRNNALLLQTLQQMLPSIEQAIAQFGAARIAVVLGTSTSSIVDGEQALLHCRQHGQWPESFDYRQQEMGNAAACLADYLQFPGIAYCISTACSSGAKALAAGHRLLQAGLCDAVIAGGVDTLCHLTVQGFASLESVAQDYCKPFDAGRDGINIGEGAALFLMTRERGFAGDDENIALLGYGESGDAYHMSAPDPSGAGGELAIRAALQRAALAPSEIGYINLHGTATRKNDEMEAALVHRVFGAQTPCSSTKSLTGHTLGAAGAIEAALCWLLLSSHNALRALPAQVGCTQYDPALPPLCLVRDQRLPSRDVAILSTSFAFGGSNAALIFRRLA